LHENLIAMEGSQPRSPVYSNEVNGEEVSDDQSYPLQQPRLQTQLPRSCHKRQQEEDASHVQPTKLHRRESLCPLTFPSCALRHHQKQRHEQQSLPNSGQFMTQYKHLNQPIMCMFDRTTFQMVPVDYTARTELKVVQDHQAELHRLKRNRKLKSTASDKLDRAQCASNANSATATARSSNVLSGFRTAPAFSFSPPPSNKRCNDDLEDCPQVDAAATLMAGLHVNGNTKRLRHSRHHSSFINPVAAAAISRNNASRAERKAFTDAMEEMSDTSM
jgi:hypothetical protein